MKVIAVAQLSDCPTRNKHYCLKFRVFRSDNTHTQHINAVPEKYTTKEVVLEDNTNYSFFTRIKDEA